jgi:hypothetical protein
MKPELPVMNVGDTVRVTVPRQGGQPRPQPGLRRHHIAKKHGGINESITVPPHFLQCRLAKGCSPSIQPPLFPWKRSAAVRYAGLSSITSVNASVKKPR